jgi:hypothetical protein
MTEPTDRVRETKEFRQSIMDKLAIEYSEAETIKSEEDKKKYIQAMEERLARLKVITDEMKEKSKTLNKETKKEFEKESERLEAGPGRNCMKAAPRPGMN